MNIIQNYLNIKEQVLRLKSDTKLVVVTKNQNIENINKLIEAGHKDFGENKVQESYLKWNSIIKDKKNIKLHLIGRLQTNKAKQAFFLFDYIHSLDNAKLAKIFSSLEYKNDKKIKYFIQVNIGKETQKSGIDISLVKNFSNYCKNDLKLDVCGLMCIPPQKSDPEYSFNLLKKLNDENNFKEISMGMSADYDKAINCGSTCVRIGSSIFR